MAVHHQVQGTQIASQRFEISYPDGSKKKVSAFRVAQMQVSGEVKQMSDRFVYAGHARTFHTFVDLAQWHTLSKLNPEELRRYLERLEVIFANPEREWQAEETPEGFTQRLQAMGMPATGFSEAVA